jgi:hypothetical protein
MPCLFAAAVLLLPRITILYLYFLTNWFQGVFTGILWPVLGFIFAPTTLIWYSVVEQVYGGTWGTLQIVVLVIAVLIDLSPTSGKKKKRSSSD